MAAIRLLMDNRVFILSGMVLALVFGFDSDYTSTLLTVILMVMMTISLVDVRFDVSDLRTYRKDIVWSILSTFVINTSFTLLAGLFFLDDTALWYGWIMLAIAPCAIACVSSAVYLNGDIKMAVIGLTMVYVTSMVITPVLSMVLIGDAVNPLEILKYIVLFVTVPFMFSIPLRRLGIKPIHKVIGINFIMFLMVTIGLGSRQDYILEHVGTSVWILFACVIRICVVSTAMVLLMRRLHVRREKAVVFNTMMYWKNSTMVASLCMVLLGATYPDATVPCVISLIVETVWFSLMTRFTNRLWPEETR